MQRLRDVVASAGRYLAERDVAPESVAFAAVLVSMTAGAVLAAGGAAGQPRLWFLVPALGLVRLVLFALESRLVDCRARIRLPEERRHGHR